jgi:hypothetical protein
VSWYTYKVSGIQKLIGRIHRHTAWRSHKPTLGTLAKNGIQRAETKYRAVR